MHATIGCSRGHTRCYQPHVVRLLCLHLLLPLTSQIGSASATAPLVTHNKQCVPPLVAVADTPGATNHMWLDYSACFTSYRHPLHNSTTLPHQPCALMPSKYPLVAKLLGYGVSSTFPASISLCTPHVPTVTCLHMVSLEIMGPSTSNSQFLV
jgi:hypothetical protein